MHDQLATVAAQRVAEAALQRFASAELAAQEADQVAGFRIQLGVTPAERLGLAQTILGLVETALGLWDAATDAVTHPRIVQHLPDGRLPRMWLDRHFALVTSRAMLAEHLELMQLAESVVAAHQAEQGRAAGIG